MCLWITKINHFFCLYDGRKPWVVLPLKTSVDVKIAQINADLECYKIDQKVRDHEVTMGYAFEAFKLEYKTKEDKKFVIT